nr:hypothetical protein [Tanacetum cinerariifolium]
MEHVAKEAVHKELGDNLVRAVTAASSLEAKHDNGGGPRCQEAIGDAIAQTRFENLSKQSNDSLLSRDSLKRRIKKLERRNRSRTYKLKRLYKVGLTARVESSDNEESLDLSGEEVFVVEQEVVSSAATTVTTEEITLAQALEALKTSKLRAGEELLQESTKKHKVKDDKETTELKQLMEIIPDKEEVAIDAIPLAVKSLGIVDWKIYKEGKKSYYQTIRADGKS